MTDEQRLLKELKKQVVEIQVGDILRKADLKSTGPRCAVYVVLDENKQGMTHAEVAKALESEGLDKTTVYRNLVDFVKARLAVRFDKGDHVWRFRLVKHHTEEECSPEPHEHLLCGGCGMEVCLPKGCVKVKGVEGLATEVSVRLFGKCRSCSEGFREEA